MQSRCGRDAPPCAFLYAFPPISFAYFSSSFLSCVFKFLIAKTVLISIRYAGMNDKVYPLTFKPVYKSALWGGTTIAERFRRADAPACCSESWEVSAHPDGMGVVEQGAWAGKTLAEVVAAEGTRILGTLCEGRRFPLLIKLIDARERLSVQVHPDDETAEKFGGEAKTEMWYILEAKPKAEICAGLLPIVKGPRQFHDAVVAKTVGRLLRMIPSVKGKSLFVPGGLVHAVCEGNLIFEVQQSSNTTYRVYDWGHLDTDGRMRETHVQKAMEVINWRAPEMDLLTPVPMTAAGEGNRRYRMLRSDYFTLDALNLSQPEKVELDGSTFHALFVEEGTATLQWQNGEIMLPLGKSCLIPAGMGSYTLAPSGEKGARVLTVSI